MEYSVKKIISELKEYPTDWIYSLGKVQGSIATREQKTVNYFRVVVPQGNKDKKFEKQVYFDKDNKQEKRKIAEKLRYDECWNRGLLKNKIRFITPLVISVDMDEYSQSMFTNSSYIDFIQGHSIYPHETEPGSNIYYATIPTVVDRTGKSRQMLFHKYVCVGNKIIHIDRNLMNNVSENLRNVPNSRRLIP